MRCCTTPVPYFVWAYVGIARIVPVELLDQKHSMIVRFSVNRTNKTEIGFEKIPTHMIFRFSINDFTKARH